MTNEDKLFFEQRFKAVGISESEFLLYLDCLRHSREVSSDSEIILCRFDKMIEVNFSLGIFENNQSKTIGGFISDDGNSILFACEKNDYETNKIIRYIISRIILMRMSAKYGMQVRINSCGKGFRIVHISSVITSGDIGEYYTAFPNTLIGEGTRGRLS